MCRDRNIHSRHERRIKGTTHPKGKGEMRIMRNYGILVNNHEKACFHVQIEILLGKTENFDELMAAAAEGRAAAEGEDQS